MVDNSLGRYWIERNPESKLAEKLEYFVTPKDGKINYINEKVLPQDLTFFDPCMGSGHILVYAFDVLMEIYRECGYSDRDAALNIVQNNLYGLDIDKRAYQLAYFAVMMKARSFNRRALTQGIWNNVSVIEESNGIDRFNCNGITNDNTQNKIGEYLIDTFRHAKEIGSLQTVEKKDYKAFTEYLLNLASQDAQLDLFSSNWMASTVPIMLKLVKQAAIMSNKYAVVCTNPPYMNKLESHLKDFVVNNYKAYSGDLFSVFMYRNFGYCKKDGYSAFMTPFVWMFIKTYEALRNYILATKSITTLVQMEYSAFEEATVPICSFVLQNGHTDNKSLCFRLSDFKGGMEVQKQKVLEALENKDCGYFYESAQDNFSKIPGSPIAYWVSDKLFHCFESSKKLSDITATRKGLATSDNNYFLRLWFEISLENMYIGCHSNEECKQLKSKWYPHNKGGSYNKWYGNNEYVINWKNDGYEIRNFRDNNGKLLSRPQNTDYNFKQAITWSKITSGSFSARFCEGGFLFDDAAAICYSSNTDDLKYYLAILNTTIVQFIVKILNPTINLQISDVGNIPIIDSDKRETIILMSENSISVSKTDWDSFETSWNFKRHPLVALVDSGKCSADRTNHSSLITDHYNAWEQACADRFNTLKSNEEELNRIFIDIYGLQDELTPEVADKDVTVRKADKTRDIKSLISYAVGCMFGRYSLDVDGLAYAGGNFSDKWVVISGQYYLREVVEKYVSQELSRVNCVAESNGFSDGSIQAGEASPERGTICTVRPDEESGGVDSVQHCRGTSEKLYEGICKLPFNNTGLEGGNGNTAYDLCSPEILNAIASESGAELVSRGWKDADSVDWKTIHQSLITDHYGADSDNCIPITDEEYFGDDIVGRFVQFVKAVYGEDTLEENLDFIASALSNKGNASREIIRNYFLNDFMKDHIKTYQKRPIYWLFDSGKENAFKALVYMHRWNADTVGNVRVEYLHRLQRVYEKEINRMQETVDNSANAHDIAAAQKRKEKLTKQLKEVKDYDAKIAHIALSRIDIDLDDGVKVNYEKVQTVDGKKIEILAKI